MTLPQFFLQYTHSTSGTRMLMYMQMKGIVPPRTSPTWKLIDLLTCMNQ